MNDKTASGSSMLPSDFDPLAQSKEQETPEYRDRLDLARKVLDHAIGESDRADWHDDPDVLAVVDAPNKLDYAEWHACSSVPIEDAVRYLLALPTSDIDGFALWSRYHDRFKQVLTRAKGAAHGGTLAVFSDPDGDYVKPAAFLAWAEKNGYTIPAQMQTLCESTQDRNKRITRRAIDIYRTLPDGQRTWKAAISLVVEEERGRSNIGFSTARRIIFDLKSAFV